MTVWCGSASSAAATSAPRSSGCSTTNADLITRRSGVRLEVARVAVQQPRRRSATSSSRAGVLTNDADAVVADRDVDVVVEVIGGVEPARRLILTALKAGKPVVTANKELLANFGEELFEAAETRRASTCCSRRRSRAASRSCGRCASRSPASASAA